MLTPMDIDQKVFKKSMRGYNVEDVEAFLMEISESYEELYLEHQEAKEQIALLSDAVAQYKSMEETLKNGLAVAQRDGEELKQAAREEAERIWRDGKAKAEEEMSRLSYQYEQMKHSVEIFRSKVVSLLHAQLDIIKEYGESEAFSVPEKETEPQLAYEEIPLEEQATMEIPVVCGDDATIE